MATKTTKEHTFMEDSERHKLGAEHIWNYDKLKLKKNKNDYFHFVSLWEKRHQKNVKRIFRKKKKEIERKNRNE